MKNITNKIKKGIIGISLLCLAGLAGCVTIMPTAPSLTEEYCKSVVQKNGPEILYKDTNKILIGINSQGYDNNSGTMVYWWNYWLYTADSDGTNWRLLDKFPSEAPSYGSSGYIRKAFIASDQKIYFEYSYDDKPESERWYVKINLDGTERFKISFNDFYFLHMEFVVSAVSDFMAGFLETLAAKEYDKAENLRLEMIANLTSYMEKYMDKNSYFKGNTKYRYDILKKAKARLEGIVGLSDPALCRLREKFIAAIDNDKIDDANRIYDLIEKMEAKYKSVPVQLSVQQNQSVPVESAQQSQKIIVQHQDAPSVGKQMRALGTMASGLEGGMTPQQQNGWMTLFGLGDFIDASDKE